MQVAKLAKEQNWRERYNISVGGYKEIAGDYRSARGERRAVALTMVVARRREAGVVAVGHRDSRWNHANGRMDHCGLGAQCSGHGGAWTTQR